MAQRAIVNFLVQRFTDGDIRRMASYSYPDSVAHLPGSGAALFDIADAWVNRLEKEGRLDRAFFDLLRAERERFVAVIDGLERQTLAAAKAVEAASPAASPSRPTTRAPTKSRRAPKTAYRWLHLTDIHYGCRGHAEWVQVVDDFERSLDPWLSKIGGPIDLVLVTGDLTNRATRGEFTGVNEFFDRVLARIEAATGHRPLLLAVPGNHDLTRPADLLDFAAFDRYVIPDDPQARRLHERLWVAKNPDLLRPLFAEYTRWVDSAVLPALRDRDDVTVHQSFFPGDLTVVLDTPGRFPLAIVGLNSAWLHYQDTRPGALALPAEQFLAALPQPAIGSPLDLFGRVGQALLLHHHPRSWFSPRHQELHDRSIYTPRRFAACLFGHMHEPTAASVAVAGGDARCYLQAPSLFGLHHYGSSKEERIFGYAFGMLREDGELRLWPLRSHLAANHESRFTRDLRFHWKDDKYALLRRGKRARSR